MLCAAVSTDRQAAQLWQPEQVCLQQPGVPAALPGGKHELGLHAADSPLKADVGLACWHVGAWLRVCADAVLGVVRGSVSSALHRRCCHTAHFPCTRVAWSPRTMTGAACQWRALYSRGSHPVPDPHPHNLICVQSQVKVQDLTCESLRPTLVACGLQC